MGGLTGLVDVAGGVSGRLGSTFGGVHAVSPASASASADGTSPYSTSISAWPRRARGPKGLGDRIRFDLFRSAAAPGCASSAAATVAPNAADVQRKELPWGDR